VEDDNRFMSDIKYTSQAILALGGDNDAEEWLLDETGNSDNLDWFLQIDSDSTTSCTITEGGSLGTVQILDDKTVTGSTGCLTPSNTGITGLDDYWFFVDEGCYGTEIVVSCTDSGFTTNLLYKENTGTDNIIYISEVTKSASLGGETKTTVNSSCFGSPCDYEGSLWATTILNFLEEDMTSHLPYLITEADEDSNDEFLPEAFLYHLTGDATFKTELLEKQITGQNGKYWQATSTNDKFYDTAVVLYVFLHENNIPQKDDSIRWLLDNQDPNGCWDSGDIRNTAFLLFGIEPRSFQFGNGGGPPGSTPECVVDNDCSSSGLNATCDNGTCRNQCSVDADCSSNEKCDNGLCKSLSSANSCVDAGFSCMSGIRCSQADGNVLNNYACAGTFVCCDQERILEPCSTQGGSICQLDQECSGIASDASDLFGGETCCVSGSCRIPSDIDRDEVSECEAIGGTCRISSCFEGEEESFESCDFSTDICCLGETKKVGGGVSAFWIWFLLILISSVILGMVFRNRLRPFWFKVKSRFNKGTGPGPGTRPDVSPSPMAYRGIPRRIIPPPHRPPVRRPSGQQGDLKNVLKKLKDMGK